MNPLLVTLDIETSPRVGLFFGNTFNANIGKVVAESYVLGFSWKPLGKKVRSCYIWDFPLYKKDPTNDIEVVRKWIEVVSGADVVIGQNSRSFDDKVMLGRAIKHQLPAPTPFLTIDTMADTKRVARYDSNKLDDVAKAYGFGGKAQTGGIDLWWDSMDVPGFKKGNPKAQRKMVRYCERDVEITEKRYLRERPYYKNHPALNVLAQKPEACTVCLKENIAPGLDYHSTKNGRYKYYTCRDCGHRMKARVQEMTPKQERVKYVG